jgi:hypothetical protein
MQPRKSIIRILKTELQVSLPTHGANEISCSFLSSVLFGPFLLIYYMVDLSASHILYSRLSMGEHTDFGNVKIKVKFTLPIVRLLKFHPSKVNDFLLYGNSTCSLLVCQIYLNYSPRLRIQLTVITHG